MIRALLVSVVLAGCQEGPEDAPAPFERSVLRVGGEPSSVVAGDVTGDGAVDLVVAGQAAGRITVFRGDGSGVFSRGTSAPAGENPVDLALADLDGDGHPDVAIANHETDHLTLLRGDGTGSFEPFPTSPLRLDVAPHPHAVAAADLDADGRLDLIVDHREREGLLVLRGLGDGRFEAAGVADVGGDPYRGMAVADLDGDGNLDLVAPIEDDVAVRLGDGRGAFRTPPGDHPPGAGVRPFGVAVADLNGDGAFDIGAGSGEGAREVAVLLGDGRGAFEPAPGSPVQAGLGPKKLAAADVDGDGFGDLLVASWGSRELTVLFGGEEIGGAAGAGDAGARIRTATVEAGENPWGLATADFDGDGTTDIAVASQGDGRLTILLSRPDRTGAADEERGADEARGPDEARR